MQRVLRRLFFAAIAGVLSGCWKFSPAYPHKAETFPPSARTCPRNGMFRALPDRRRGGLLMTSTATEAGFRARGSPEKKAPGETVRKDRRPDERPRNRPERAGSPRPGRKPGSARTPSSTLFRTGETDPPARAVTRKPRLQPTLSGVRWPRSADRGALKDRVSKPDRKQHGRPPPCSLRAGDGRLVLLGEAFLSLQSGLFDQEPRTKPFSAEFSLRGKSGCRLHNL